ncbi:hypothetical protein [Formivibrio citricus]|uniref:hypothetical protein n=1 Tax=Formivibrio citricus TaxID=83765 RepID=UPI001FDEFEAD|nr:hypothetical protein [Formivibrio citricus]
MIGDFNQTQLTAHEQDFGQQLYLEQKVQAGIPDVAGLRGDQGWGLAGLGNFLSPYVSGGHHHYFLHLCVFISTADSFLSSAVLEFHRYFTLDQILLLCTQKSANGMLAEL